MRTTSIVVCLLLAAAATAVFVPGRGGYITVEPSFDGKLWYWLFDAQKASPTDDSTPFVLWLTGGPGCSGSLAALNENGPYSVDSHLKLKSNPYSWNNNANMLYIDQPFGVGFSSSPPEDYVHNTTEAMGYVVTFLEMFFEQNPQYAKQPFFITGESYGGHYVPELARQILANSPALASRLQAMEIGNGMIDPLLQFPMYPAYAKKFDLVSNNVIKEADNMVADCVALIKAGEVAQAYQTCLPIIGYILENTNIDGHQINPYNRLEPCLDGSLCYNFTAPTDWLNEPAVQAALNVDPSIKWATCNFDVNADFTDWTVSYADGVTAMLEGGKRVYIMAGMLDYICNYLGSQAVALDVPWSGKAAFNAAPMQQWYVGSDNAGSVQTYKNLNLVFVEGAGHMVPMDQPKNALVFFDHFITNTAFNTTSA
ncbi:serine carboxypeptidase [Thecamonas trahens ATCC 50062]|uniref:Carboxypeptidase n=1 Tax=Thecamonas trahens ATCC 50062 TaxID=461836 RepID=A0A0L0DGX2_THETB|nr:serine carboxypeptidase [Thecamonas trahens ATCC 50062]KNC51584.1 serine carboxypeptidase [Thecamonas trahens ATCC 50062]|eukprot:XP_013755984.1 serine carboxypeptidase [Thecamonas trahens ATCC 50062]